MKITLTELRDHDETEVSPNGKTRLEKAKTDVTVNGKTYKGAIAWITLGQAMDAGIIHDDIPSQELEEISSWWYGVNYAGEEYEFGTETELS